MLPCGGRPRRSKKITIFLFVDVALRDGSILKKHIFIDLFNFLDVAKLLYVFGF